MAGPSAAERRKELRCFHFGEVDGAVDHRERLPPQEVRQIRERREPQQPDAGRRGLIQFSGPPLVGREDLRRALDREHQPSGIDLGNRKYLEFQRAHHPEVGTCPPDRPEQVLLQGGDAAENPVAGDDLDGGDPGRGQPVFPGQPAVAAAEGVAHHTDVRRRSGQRGQPVRRQRRGDVPPQRAGTDPDRARRHVDRHLTEQVGPQQDGIGEIAERGGIVPGALRSDPQSVAAGEGDHLRHLGGTVDPHHERGLLVDAQIPGQCGGRPLGVAVGDQATHGGRLHQLET